MIAVARAIGLPGEVVDVETVARAWSNKLSRVRTTAGEFAVKELLNPWSDPHWLDWLDQAVAFEQAAIEAGVSAPAIRLNHGRQVLTEVDGRHFRAHHWVEEASPCPEAPVPLEVAMAVGADLARTHLLDWRPTRRDVFPTVSAATGRGWGDLVAELADVDGDWAARAAAVSSEVTTVLQWFEQWQQTPAPEVMSHGDVDPKNLVLDGAGRPWLVDWDVAAPWRPMDELARTALSMSGHDRPDLARAVIDAYAEVGAVVGEFSHLNLVVDLVVGLDWTRRCLRRATGLEPCHDQRRAEALGSAESELADLPSVVAVAAELGDWLTG